MDIILLNDGDDDVLIPPLPLLRPKKKILRKQTKVKKRLHSKLTGKKGRWKAKYECNDVTSVPNVMETRSMSHVCHVTWSNEVYRRDLKDRQPIDQSREK